MPSPPVPDPYNALGLPKDATAQQIKSVYRKLALKYHPDKVTDEALKASASDNFHRIQQAYEIVGDDDRRQRYDASIRLAELRRDVMEKQAARTDVRTAAFEVPLSPAGAAFTARGPARYNVEVQTPAGYDSNEDGYFAKNTRSKSKKNAEYVQESRKWSPKEDAEKIRVFTKENERANRKDSRRTTDKDRRRDRGDKEEKVKKVYAYERDGSEEEEPEDVARFMRGGDKYADREKDYFSAPKRPRDNLANDDVATKYWGQADEAVDYMRSKGGRSERPSNSRSNSARDLYDMPQERPKGDVRRSSARKVSGRGDESRRSSGAGREKERDRERKYSVPEVEESRRPSLFHNFKSSPAAFKEDRESRRSQTVDSYESGERSPPPFLNKRSDTMPNITSSAGRKGAAPAKPSTLRQAVTNDHGLLTPEPTPEYMPDTYTSSKQHRMPEDEWRAGRRTQIVDPEDVARERHVRSPSPTPGRKPRGTSGRYPGAPPPLRTTGSYQAHQSASPTSYYDTKRPSPLGRRASEQVPDLRYGEILTPATPTTTKRYDYSDSPRERVRQLSPDDISYSRKPVPEDIKTGSGHYSTRSRGRGTPSMSRTVSYAY